MEQAVKLNRKGEPLHEYLVRSINIGLAAKTFNDMLQEIPVSPQRERAATTLINKLVPSMAALSVEVTDSRPVNVHDLNTLLTLNGLDALPLPGQAIEHQSEKVNACEKTEEVGYPRDASE